MELGNNPVDEYCRNYSSKPKQDPEFESFEKKVDEISQILADFNSKDEKVSAAAVKKAKLLLGPSSNDIDPEKSESKIVKSGDININSQDNGVEILGAGRDAKVGPDDETKVRVKNNKTVINQKAFDTFYEKKENDNMSQDAFMRSVEEDAKRRFEDKKERREIAEKYKKFGNKAFQSGEYEAALVQYDKAIDQVRDMPLLYTNRALTYIHLELYDQVLPDCEKALRLDEHNMKAHLYKARATYCLGDKDKAYRYIEDIIEKYPRQKKVIESYTNTFLDREEIEH